MKEDATPVELLHDALGMKWKALRLLGARRFVMFVVHHDCIEHVGIVGYL